MSEFISAGAVPQVYRDELRARSLEIRSALESDHPGIALSVFQQIRTASSPLVADSLSQIFGETMQAAEQGKRIAEGHSVIRDLAQTYFGLRGRERAVLVDTAAQELTRVATEDGSAGEEILDGIAADAGHVVLTGTAQQLFFGDLASRLGLLEDPPAVLLKFFAKVIPALSTALVLGAPGTRNDLMEGLGALLRHFDDKAGLFQLPSIAKHERDTLGAPDVNDAYEKRHRRHEEIVRAIAADPQSRATYFATVESPVQIDYDHRAEYLRALPSICRQEPAATRSAMYERAIRILCSAAAEVSPAPGASSKVEAEFTRYQETVFRTIDLLLERKEVDPTKFDATVANAVAMIPPTLVGSLDVCNGYARATVAVLVTAAKIAARVKEAHCDAAVEPLYRGLDAGWKEWMNPGIIEGCVRGLPLLLQDSEHDAWTTQGLDALLRHLVQPTELSDLAGTHVRLCATASFRSLMIQIAEQSHAQTIAPETSEEQQQLAQNVERTVRRVLANPTADEILAVFKADPKSAKPATGAMPRTYAAGVVSAVAFSSEALKHAEAMFNGWEQMSPAQQLLLVRILGLQLRSASHGRSELARCPVLMKVLAGLAAVRLDERDRADKLWRLLSEIPSEACDAADPDLQEFVAYRSGRSKVLLSDDEKRDDDDLPGYVLSMVSDTVSYRLAADIARQVDLNRHRSRLDHDSFDFAEPLYQVMLRGPNIAIFDHLLARIPEKRDRTLLVLLRKHVQTVQACIEKAKGVADSKAVALGLVESAEILIADIVAYKKQYGSDTLDQLERAMRQFVVLARPAPVMWEVIIGKPRDAALRKLFEPEEKSEDGGLEVFFRLLDTLAGDDMHSRKKIAELCAEECLQLRVKIEQYLNLPVGEFRECDRALREAVKMAAAIRQKLHDAGLEPPERHILDALLRSWEDMFRHTIEWWVDAPRRGVDARRPKWFWAHIVNGLEATPDPDMWPQGSIHIKERPAGEPLQKRLYGREVEAELPLPPERTRPPIPPSQKVAFERFYVDWMASRLDVDHLRWALGERWGLFLHGYNLMTSRLGVAILIALPCVLAALLDSRAHQYAGIGFFVYLVGLCTLTFVALVGRRLKSRLRDLWRAALRHFGWPVEAEKEVAAEYRFQALLPRLFRLIIVPIALVVDFDHSYLFPMHASNAVLVILMMLAVLTTSFFIRRELRARQTEYSRLEEETTVVANEGRRVGQIVSIALTHSFAVALLFSVIFESSIIARTKATDEAMASLVHSQSKEGEGVLHHEEKYFLHVLPREAECNMVGVATWLGVPFADRMHVRFYPTLILTWTALGLFFGLFLDGFMKGERLREEVSH
jgi:hypothetical protein